ncbi:cytochrome P450 [Pseudofrankia inefficax]|uniref:Cytochrome P450 n=1 Tax=Pseudofrankia inefficax (strain DSM 45817 / CECT 9037 / DDB 130130 / EuI1c) TaxID=298654 RepID=E3JAS8_PSEI1|nr:cytochrome P450 [Pseudofrankia inefficax]ADP83416.1 cytochrome P450 [Pseudofrankia inefficax]
MSQLAEADLYWDPFDKVIDTNPYPIWRRLRDSSPVYRNERHGFYAYSRHADIDEAHRDAATYSSAYGTVLEIMTSEPMPPAFMIFTDPPLHNTLRTLVSRAFTPRRVARLEGAIRDLCAEMLDPQVGGSGFDYVQDFAAQLPSKVISELIGVDPADREHVRQLIDLTFHHDESAGMVNDVAREAVGRLNGYFREQIDARRKTPRDDMITGLAEAEVATEDGPRRLSTEQAAAVTNEIVSAGTETVARLLGWFGVVLAANPDQRAELAADASLIPNAVEELLRYEPPSPVQGRTTTRDVVIHDVEIPAGSKVLLLTGSAGRDERKYPNADQFDIHRKFDSHVTFGHGIHFCLGAGLARLEGRIAIEETLRRFPAWQVDHDNAVRLHTSTVRGYEKLPFLL